MAPKQSGVAIIGGGIMGGDIATIFAAVESSRNNANSPAPVESAVASHQIWRAASSVSAMPGSCGARPRLVASPVAAKAQAPQRAARRGAMASPERSIAASSMSA